MCVWWGGEDNQSKIEVQRWPKREILLHAGLVSQAVGASSSTAVRLRTMHCPLPFHTRSVGRWVLSIQVIMNTYE